MSNLLCWPQSWVKELQEYPESNNLDDTILIRILDAETVIKLTLPIITCNLLTTVAKESLLFLCCYKNCYGINMYFKRPLVAAKTLISQIQESISQFMKL